MSLREFAKRKRVNSWQSTENFCGGFGFLGWNFVEFECGGIFLECGLDFLGFLAEVLREFVELVA